MKLIIFGNYGISIVELHFDISFVKIGHQNKKLHPRIFVKIYLISGILVSDFFSFHRERGILWSKIRLIYADNGGI